MHVIYVSQYNLQHIDLDYHFEVESMIPDLEYQDISMTSKERIALIPAAGNSQPISASTNQTRQLPKNGKNEELWDVA